MAENRSEPPPRVATTSGALPQPSAAIRQRLSQHQWSRPESSPSPRPPSLLRRRSSLLSYSSFEDATQSFAEDMLGSGISSRRPERVENEVTHWHSTPLAFAILPAVGGLLFQNGSAFVTDVLLLGLAAIFMNWSIRLPWDWYYTAQALQKATEFERNDDMIPEETEADEIAIETTSSAPGSPIQSPANEGVKAELPGTNEQSSRRREAAAELRRQEMLALLATFILPGLAAYLLHIIRAQLSRPSTSLVSDYNLSIFLLAAQIRPVRQLVRLISNRTLYLQRSATGLDDPSAAAAKEKTAFGDLTVRIAELEAKLSNHTLVDPAVSIAQKADVSELSIEMKKRYEPRLEGLERAVRRYEKRSTTQTLLTEQRLQNLENRTNDAFSLAAVAAKHSQSRGFIATMFDSIKSIVALPLGVAWGLCVWPFAVVEDLYARLKTLILGPTPPRLSKRRSQSKQSNLDDKSTIRGSMRKPAS